MPSEVAISLNWKFDPASRSIWKEGDLTERYGSTSKLSLSAIGQPSSPEEISVKARVWHDKLEGWYFEPLSKLASPGAGQFVAASVLLSFIEGLEQVHSGPTPRNQAGAWFSKGCQRILAHRSVFRPDPLAGLTQDEVWSAMYAAFRCGLAHDGFSRPSTMHQSRMIQTRVGTKAEVSAPIEVEFDAGTPATVRIFLCPERLLACLRSEVARLSDELQQSTDPRRTHLDQLLRWPE